MDTDQKTNPVLEDLVQQCEEAGRRNDAAVWTRVAEELARANRDQRTVNVSDIETNTEEGETVVIPGKVLGSGRLTKDVTVAAFQFSRAARDRIEEEGEAVYLEDLVEDNPEGDGVTLLG